MCPRHSSLLTLHPLPLLARSLHAPRIRKWVIGAFGVLHKVSHVWTSQGVAGLYLQLRRLTYVVNVGGNGCVCAYGVLLHESNQIRFCEVVRRRCLPLQSHQRGCPDTKVIESCQLWSIAQLSRVFVPSLGSPPAALLIQYVCFCIENA